MFYVPPCTCVKATVVCDIIMLYAIKERKVYKKSIVDDELRSANVAIAQTAFALVNRAVSHTPRLVTPAHLHCFLNNL